MILDNLIAAGKAEPMLVVMANGNVPGPGGARGYSSAAMAAFGDELLNNVVPFVEAHYRVAAGAENRALAGLSMGGGQSFFVGLGNKGRFGSIGIFSTGLFGGIAPPARRRPPAPFDAEEQMPGLLSDARSFNDALKVLYISVGEQDPRFEPTKKAVADFKAHGLNVEFASFPGGARVAGLEEVAPRLRPADLQAMTKAPRSAPSVSIVALALVASVASAQSRHRGEEAGLRWRVPPVSLGSDGRGRPGGASTVRIRRADLLQLQRRRRPADRQRGAHAASLPSGSRRARDPRARETRRGLGASISARSRSSSSATRTEGKGFYASEKPRTNLRLIANIQDPSYVLVAARAETGVTDLSQIRQKRWPVRILTAGIGRDASRILAHYGLSKETIEAAGGHVGRAPDGPWRSSTSPSAAAAA